LVRDERIPASTRAVAKERGFRSLSMLPLVVGERTIGVLALYSEQQGFFDSGEMRLLNELSGHIAFAVDHIDKAERLEYLSFYDPVTGLANRMLLMDRLSQAIASTGEGEQVALVLVDIERFKAINDAFGRPAGDALLAKMAERLIELARHGNRVAHVGGDRFAVIVPGVRAPGRVARSIDEGFARIEGEPFRLGDTELRLAIRSGIAFFPNDGADADVLFKNAESALKKAKESGSKYLFYTEKLTERFAERLSLENKLRRAIEREEFVLHYQPKMTLAPRRIASVEALIRWRSAEGLIQPASFIPLLEESGLIVPVGAWALKRAMLDQLDWTAQGLTVPRIAVNVSPIQLRHAGFLDVVRQALGDGGAPAAIDLEITESVIMEDIAANIEKLKAIRLLGIDIAIDDFGTGYSSLGYLTQLPVQSLKIDRSFVAAMEKEPSAMTLVSTIISLAHSLRLKVVAEGVETERQAELLHLLHCDEMQGYLFSKPVPAEVLADALRASP
jgi:diguanylate cyclase (GGDEF)-like protein